MKPFPQLAGWLALLLATGSLISVVSERPVEAALSPPPALQASVGTRSTRPDRKQGTEFRESQRRRGIDTDRTYRLVALTVMLLAILGAVFVISRRYPSDQAKR